jgi:hypothetical protein
VNLENRIRKCFHCILVMLSWAGKDLGTSTVGDGLAIHFRGKAHAFVCFAGMVEEGRALLLTADDVFGNYWWFEINTNSCFGGCVDVSTFTFAHKTRDQTGA